MMYALSDKGKIAVFGRKLFENAFIPKGFFLIFIK